MKSKILIAGTVAALFASVAVSCSVKEIKNMAMNVGGRVPSGEIVEKTFDFGHIEGLEAYQGIVVHYTQTPETAPVLVRGPKDVVDAAQVKMSGTTLECMFESGTNFRFSSDDKRLHVYVKAPLIDDYEAYSGANISVSDTLNIYKSVDAEACSGASISFATLIAPKVSFEANSGASVTADAVTADEFNAEASSGADISAAGKAGEVDLEVSSGASISCTDLKAERGEASASSGGGISCAIRNAEINRSSGGSVSNRSDF